MQRNIKILISGGGTGGHIFPAIAIADYMREHYAPCEILFIGATGKMEMEKVPNAGYQIIGLPIVGLQRKLDLKNLLLPFKLVNSIKKALQVVSQFKPDVAVGVGGYASGPAMMAALIKNVPVLLQEQNGFAGKTNKWLGKYARVVCVAYDGMNKFFRNDKIVLTGNPIRNDVIKHMIEKATACEYFGFYDSNPVVLVTGGSLGARTVNESIMGALPKLVENKINVIWQCGKTYFSKNADNIKAFENVRLLPFIEDMGKAYSAADIVISRAGAISISELCAVGKPTILIPSPNVAEDHQTHNALSLVNKNAAIMIKDDEAVNRLEMELLNLIMDSKRRVQLSENMKQMAMPDADKLICEQIMRLIKV